MKNYIYLIYVLIIFILVIFSAVAIKVLPEYFKRESEEPKKTFNETSKTYKSHLLELDSLLGRGKINLFEYNKKMDILIYSYEITAIRSLNISNPSYIRFRYNEYENGVRSLLSDTLTGNKILGNWNYGITRSGYIIGWEAMREEHKRRFNSEIYNIFEIDSVKLFQ